MKGSKATELLIKTIEESFGYDYKKAKKYAAQLTKRCHFICWWESIKENWR